MHVSQLDQMSINDLRDFLRTRAKVIAYLDHLRTHPGSAEEARDFSEHHWCEFRENAIDHLALTFALSEQDAASGA